jgi:cyclohexyl-isocyanide hydratase
MNKLKVGMLVFPEMTILDFTGPYDVFVRASCYNVLIIGADTSPFKVEGGMQMQAELAWGNCPQLDILFVPGGKGINPLMSDKKFISFLQRQAENAKYITSVCTGSLLLGAAGLLTGYRATTHWRSLELLERFGAQAVNQRVVVDRNRITGGGITAGIDFALSLTAMIGGETMAKTVQLILEYAPQPPFQSGSPDLAEPTILATAKEMTQALFDQRVAIIDLLEASGTA